MSKPIPPVSKFMTTTPITVERTTTIAQAAKLMRDQSIRHLPVMDGEKLLGIITERDIHFVQSFDLVDPEQVTVYGAMSEELYTVSPDAALDEVVGTMARQKWGSAVVVQNKHVVGVLTTVDVCRAFSELLTTRLRA